jgi:RNA polymerase sigma-70 factor, ECF subfamily
MVKDVLAEEFRAASPRDADADEAALAAALAAAVDAGRAAWPAIKLEPRVFVRHLARHRAGGEPPDRWLASVRATDLYLACGCAESAPGAVEAFEREHMPLIDRYLLRARAQRPALDELRQRVREKLLVGARKIAEYSGRGTLTKWLEVVALRVAIDLARERRDVLLDDSVDSIAGATTDPELDYIKEKYRAQFKQALQQAISALDGEQRNLLRLHFVDGVTLEQLSALFHVHRATVVRRIAAARESILDGARALLARDLAIAGEEVDSLLRLVRSRLDLSLSALLTPAA